jgi:DNA anti-recombination protein RmuC
MADIGLRVIKNAEIEGKLNVESGATISGSLRIPLTSPATRDVGDIWYDPNITSPGGSSGGSVDTGKQVTAIQYTPNEVDLYDGSTRVVTFKMDNSVDKIVYDSSTKTIKVPNGVILGNMNGSDSIELEKNALNNTVKFSVNNSYVDKLASTQAHMLTDSLNVKVDNFIIETKANVNSLETKIDSLNNDLDSKTNDLNSRLDSKSSSINQRIDNFSQEQSTINSDVYTRLQTIFNDIDQINTSITNQETDQNAKYSALSTSQDEMLGRLLEIDGDKDSSLKNQVASLIDNLSAISAEITKIKNKINSIHGAGTI